MKPRFILKSHGNLALYKTAQFCNDSSYSQRHRTAMQLGFLRHRFLLRHAFGKAKAMPIRNEEGDGGSVSLPAKFGTKLAGLPVDDLRFYLFMRNAGICIMRVIGYSKRRTRYG